MINYIDPKQLQERYNEYVERSGIKIIDPISKGEGLAYNIHYCGEDENYLSIGIPKHINNNINPLYKILETEPIQIQHKPLMIEFSNSEDAEYYNLKLVKVNRILQMQMFPDQGTIFFKKVRIGKVDNMKFMKAISRQRWLYGDNNVTKGGTRG